MKASESKYYAMRAELEVVANSVYAKEEERFAVDASRLLEIIARTLVDIAESMESIYENEPGHKSAVAEEVSDNDRDDRENNSACSAALR